MSQIDFGLGEQDHAGAAGIHEGAYDVHDRAPVPERDYGGHDRVPGEGRVAGIGTHTQLLESCAPYRRLYDQPVPGDAVGGGTGDAAASPERGEWGGGEVDGPAKEANGEAAPAGSAAWA